jgi:hypothetical protein
VRCADYSDGLVSCSNRFSQIIACSRDPPHISAEGCKLAQKAGRSGRPNIAQRSSSVSCTQRTPAGLPSGMPGNGVLMEGAMQQAAQLGRQFMGMKVSLFKVTTDSLHVSLTGN